MYDYMPVPFPIYWNPALGDTLDGLMAKVRKRLIDEIPVAVRRAGIKEPAYCLALAYDEGGEELPPVLGVGIERERRRVRETRSKEAKELLWEPQQFSRFGGKALRLDDAALAEDCRRLLQFALMKEALWVPQKLLNGVAKALNRRQWDRVLPTTDDFIVYAINFDGEDLKANLKAGVPVAKLKMLKSRGLV
jgi:hypothetical protein